VDVLQIVATFQYQGNSNIHPPGYQF